MTAGNDGRAWTAGGKVLTGIVTGLLVLVAVTAGGCSSEGSDGQAVALVDATATTTGATSTTAPPATTAPPTTAPPTTAPPTTAPPTTVAIVPLVPQSTSASYANCSEARAAGVTPLYRGDPGYAPHLDRDDDGVACE